MKYTQCCFWYKIWATVSSLELGQQETMGLMPSSYHLMHAAYSGTLEWEHIWKGGLSESKFMISFRTTQRW